MSALKTALIDKTENMLVHLEDNRKDNILFLQRALQMNGSPMQLMMAMTNYWQEYLITLNENRGELSLWVFPPPAAAWMEIIFLNLVANHWAHHPPATNEKLNPVVKQAVDDQVSYFVSMVTL